MYPPAGGAPASAPRLPSLQPALFPALRRDFVPMRTLLMRAAERMQNCRTQPGRRPERTAPHWKTALHCRLALAGGPVRVVDMECPRPDAWRPTQPGRLPSRRRVYGEAAFCRTSIEWGVILRTIPPAVAIYLGYTGAAGPRPLFAVSSRKCAMTMHWLVSSGTWPSAQRTPPAASTAASSSGV